jgi:hypothetical protein
MKIFRPILSDSLPLARESTEYDDTIQGGVLIHVMINAPAYEALSYVWGNVADTLPITCKQQSLHITKNIVSGLSRGKNLVSDLLSINSSVNFDGFDINRNRNSGTPPANILLPATLKREGCRRGHGGELTR